jgi:predicted dehydrogenase
MPHSTRRDFLKTVTTASAAALALSATGRAADSVPPRTKGKSVVGLRVPKLDTVRFGIIGLGERGGPTLRQMLVLEGVSVTALCDNHRPALDAGLAVVEKAGAPRPTDFGNGDEDFRQLVARDDVDAVLICTPWRWHVPMAVAAMRAGKHAFIEVPAAVTLEDCWQLVEVAEETQRHCMMMENCCYGRDELMLLRMCREGLFGELLHGEGAYLHDLRAQMKGISPGQGEGLWRIPEHIGRNGNLYPTHGLGPVAQYLSINRGDRFERLVSFSSPAAGLVDYAAKNLPADHPRRGMKFACGDLNTSIVKTARGRTILVQHDTSNATPYSRLNTIRGTRGNFVGYPSRIYLEGRSAKPDQWDTDLASYYVEFDHPLWKKVAEAAAKLPPGSAGGHGGMDFVMRWRIVQCLREGLPLDQDVYDAAAWSVIGPLSEQSVAQGGAPIVVPDFTRGAWETTAPLGIVS